MSRSIRETLNVEQKKGPKGPNGAISIAPKSGKRGGGRAGQTSRGALPSLRWWGREQKEKGTVC